MKLNGILVAVLLGLLSAGTALADASPTTQPAGANLVNELQLRANEDMGRNDYASALPLLQKVSELLADQPDQLGPILEQIRVCRHQMLNPPVKPPVDLTGNPMAAPPQSMAMVVDGGPRHIHPAPAAGQTIEMPIKELGNFDYDANVGGNIPADVLRMDGCHFKTTGYMIPLDQAESISEFALVPSLFACCFGQPPQIQHTIVVHCPKSKALSYFPDELIVEGTLHVKEARDGGFIVSIYQLDASSVRVAPQ
ncbi:MAG TPA: DUF3299 domain-containing protein [Tepidisphaeraceae bacterium]|jgi:hypothetical protein